MGDGAIADRGGCLAGAMHLELEALAGGAQISPRGGEEASGVGPILLILLTNDEVLATQYLWVNQPVRR